MPKLKGLGVKSLCLEMLPTELETARTLQKTLPRCNALIPRIKNIVTLLNNADQAEISVVAIDLETKTESSFARYHQRHKHIKKKLQKLIEKKGKTVVLLGIMHAHLSEELEIPGFIIQAPNRPFSNVDDCFKHHKIKQCYHKLNILSQLNPNKFYLDHPRELQHTQSINFVSSLPLIACAFGIAIISWSSVEAMQKQLSTSFVYAGKTWLSAFFVTTLTFFVLAAFQSIQQQPPEDKTDKFYNKHQHPYTSMQPKKQLTKSFEAAPSDSLWEKEENLGDSKNHAPANATLIITNQSASC